MGDWDCAYQKLMVLRSYKGTSRDNGMGAERQGTCRGIALK